MIFVCANVREGEAACANPDRGEDSGLNLVEMLRAEVKNRGLKGKVRIAKSGCMDLCGAGPNIMVFDEKGNSVYYSRVSKNDVPALAEKHLSGL